MTQLKPSVVKKRSDTAWRVRDMWRALLEEAYELAFSGINPYAPDKKAPRGMNKQFDSTAVSSTIRTVNRIVTEFTPPDQDWVSVEPGPLLEIEMEDDDEETLNTLKKKLSKVSRLGNVVINSGSAVDARSSAFLDCYVAGMGAVLGLEDPTDDVEPIIDQAVSQAEIAIEEDAKGRISGVFRKRKIKVREILSVWSDAKIPQEISDMEKGDKDPEIDVLEATYRGDAKVRWRYEIFYCAKNSEKKEPVRIVEREYDVNPWSIFRWMKLPGIAYGPGPVLLALADIRTVNKVMEMLLKNAALAMAGMYLVRDDGVINPNNIIISQGGMIPVQSTGGTMGASMVPLGTNREFNLGQIMLENLQMTIKKQLFDTSLPPDRGAPSSATEIIQRVRELSQDMGISIGRLDADIVQYVRRRLEILGKRGMIPNFKFDQFTLKVKINSPLARASQMAAVEKVIQFYEIVSTLAGPQAAAIALKLEKLIIWIAERMGVPSELVRSEDGIAEEENRLKQNALQEQEQQAAMSIAADQAQASPELALAA
jgi:hypothetical protein